MLIAVIWSVSLCPLNLGSALDLPLTSFTTVAALIDALDPDAQPPVRYPLAPYHTPRQLAHM